MFRTSNPTMSRFEQYPAAQTWDDLERQGRGGNIPPAGPASGGAGAASAGNAKVMTLQGTVSKTLGLLAICIVTATIGWNITTSADPIVSPMLVVLGGGLLGFIIALVCTFKPTTAPITAPLYALFEGFFVGGISAVYAARFSTPVSASVGTSVGGSTSGMSLNSGLVFNAALLTFGILGALCFAYGSRLIRPGPWFRNTVIVGTLGACAYALIAMVASMFGAPSLASVYDPNNGGVVSIGFSLLLVCLASANLVLDFEMIEHGVNARAPRYMEWYGAFGLMVTLVWLYLEVLRLLAKLRRE